MTKTTCTLLFSFFLFFPQQYEAPGSGLEFPKFEEAAKYIVQAEATIPITSVVFDRKRVHGQIRKLNNTVVSYYYQQLLVKGPPQYPLLIPLKKVKGIFQKKLYPPKTYPVFLQVTSTFHWADSTSLGRCGN